jgi:putative N-acetyltransferase (TIGR04045 family)
MLDAVHPWGRKLAAPLATQVVAQLASEPWQLAGYHALRQAIFVQEQALFAGSDEDEHDARATPIVGLSVIAGMPDDVVGIVRIYQSEPGVWYGGRLGVCSAYRRRGAVGAALIAAAVSTAHAWGCQRFLATVQLDNARYFERYHFEAVGEVTVCGRLHALMQADLGAYPARAATPPAAPGRAA